MSREGTLGFSHPLLRSAVVGGTPARSSSVPKRPLGIFDSMKSMWVCGIWSKMGVRTAAGVIVFWEAGATAPQPAAVLVDSSAPMWRSRRVPVEVAVPTPPHLKQYEMQTLAWLRMGEESGGDAIVDKVVQAPGGQRALITLKPNARGKTLRLALTKVAMTQPFLDGPSAVNETFTIVDTRLTRAPWEEDD